MLCNMFSRHFTNDTGVMHFLFFHFANDMGVCVFWVCPTTPMSSLSLYVYIYSGSPPTMAFDLFDLQYSF